MTEGTEQSASPVVGLKVGPGSVLVPLGAVFESTDVGYALVDAASARVFECNVALENLVGKSEADLSSGDLIALVAGDDVGRFRAGWQRLLAGRVTTVALEVDLVTIGGAAPVRLTLRHLRGMDPSQSPVLVLVEDLRAIRGMTERMSSATERLHLLAAASRRLADAGLDFRKAADAVAEQVAHLIGDSCGVYVLNEDGLHMDLIAVQSGEPAMREKIRAILTTATLRADEGLAGRLFETGETIFFPTVDPLAIAATRPALRELYAQAPIHGIIIAPLKTGGRTFGLLFIARHTPDRPFTLDEKAVAEELATTTATVIENARLYTAVVRSNEALEEKVKERTASLRETISSLDAFAGTAAHDLRSPLTTMNICGHLLSSAEEPIAPGEARSLGERVSRASQRMADMITAFLVFSKSTNAAVKRSDVDVTSLAQAAVADLREIDPSHAPEVRIEDGLTASADRVLLRIVLDNLIGNAWKFTRGIPGPKITVSSVSHPRASPGERVFCVKDNGPGFDATAVSDRLFQPFERFSDDVTGTGLGLVTVRRIVQRHGGRVWAESTPGQGAAFYFTLSPKETPSPGPETHSLPHPSARQESRRMRGAEGPS